MMDPSTFRRSVDLRHRGFAGTECGVHTALRQGALAAERRQSGRAQGEGDASWVETPTYAPGTSARIDGEAVSSGERASRSPASYSSPRFPPVIPAERASSPRVRPRDDRLSRHSFMPESCIP